MIDTLLTRIGAVFAIAVLAFALARGDARQRLAAMTFGLGWFASLLIQDETNLYGPRWGLMAVDVVVLGVFATLTWKSPRGWPIWATAFQSLTVASHLLMLVDLRPPLRAFYVVANLASYGILLSLALGVFLVWRDRRLEPKPL